MANRSATKSCWTAIGISTLALRPNVNIARPFGFLGQRQTPCVPTMGHRAKMIGRLVGGLEHFLFSHILGIIIPIDFPIFQRGKKTTNQFRQ